MSTYIPPGWPAGVHPPGSEDFESTAVGWLLDVVPPDYRLHGVLRRYPIALATMARHHSKACVEGARQGYRSARTELAGVLPPHAVDSVLAAYRNEGARLAATARAVGLVERALRGEVFTPKMSPAPATGPQAAHLQAAGPKPAGAKATEAKTAGAKATGPEPRGSKTIEAKIPGPETSEPEMAGRAGAAPAGAARAGARGGPAGERQRAARKRKAT